MVIIGGATGYFLATRAHKNLTDKQKETEK